MNGIDLATFATLLSALSVAVERIVEILKGLVPWLDTSKGDDSREESYRRMALHLLAIVCGTALAWWSWPILQDIEGLGLTGEANLGGALLLGLFASGGSGMWNSVLSYANKAKELKKEQVRRERVDG